ncbi:hypothetical protein ACFQ1M_09130 [Sungkyunkwania multivorans]|uniref:Cytochrome C Planctomycete-type domain-containing protein n=1 Tax=Sungkyunkwania multivorans TaxID=1173618 RepID=A0ABW3CXH3_9FLAO
MRIIKVSIYTCFLTVFLSCTNDSEDDLIDPTPQGPDPITFKTNIEPVLQSVCQNCHQDPPINGAPMSLVTYTQARFWVEDGSLLNRVNNENAPMPPSGLLPTTTREVFQKWKDDGFIEE